ncbi:hypothetical protein [Steroidobacter cummioxidans]|uniref:hypothetical protein n=1 Tax=Steroidobacter cummioxidans TaxID=1803913 RepID=UPI0012907CDB|nr:hypothetical protein [Steroidobacter cummioxidans]
MAAMGNRLMVGWLGLISVAVGFVAVEQANSSAKTARFEQIDVQRINVVEPDGKPRVIISNRKLFPGIYWGGKEFQHHSRDTGGFLFFNQRGDEVGGMTFDADQVGDKWRAGASLTFDQFQQDQTVGVMYSEQDGKRTAGFRVWDRPDASMEPILQLSDQAAKASSDAERQKIRDEMMGIAKTWGPAGERLFAGKLLDDSVVRLADKQGRPRLVLKVDGAGEPSVEFLDDTGKVVRRIPEK